jgi:nucleoside-diphosphate-sugar epimerase
VSVERSFCGVMVLPRANFCMSKTPLRACCLQLSDTIGDQSVNLGTGEEITIRDLAQMIAAEVGFSGEFLWDKTKPNGQPRRCLDVSRAKELFGFETSHRLREGISKTLAWFHVHRQNLP